VSALLGLAQEWMADVHPHARHLERTVDYVLELEPDAAEAIRIAAAVHDVERAYPEAHPWDSKRDWADPAYNAYHQARCAELAGQWLRDHDVGSTLVAHVTALVAVHEVGGWPAADVVQAADSLSFLDTMVPLVRSWPREAAQGKLRHSLERISPSLPRARELGRPLLRAALEALDEAPPPSPPTGARRP
jgi:hypothetical protein